MTPEQYDIMWAIVISSVLLVLVWLYGNWVSRSEGKESLISLMLEQDKRREGRMPDLIEEKAWVVPASKDCDECHHYERPPQICNLCRRGQITKLDERITDLEITLRATRGRLLRKSMTTLMIDAVLE